MAAFNGKVAVADAPWYWAGTELAFMASEKMKLRCFRGRGILDTMVGILGPAERASSDTACLSILEGGEPGTGIYPKNRRERKEDSRYGDEVRCYVVHPRWEQRECGGGRNSLLDWQ